MASVNKAHVNMARHEFTSLQAFPDSQASGLRTTHFSHRKHHGSGLPMNAVGDWRGRSSDALWSREAITGKTL